MNYSYDRRTASHPKIALSVGETFENDLWRIHRYVGSIRVTHLLEAGKKGRKCHEFAIQGNVAHESLSMEFVMLAKRGADYPRMKKTVEEAQKTGAQVHESIIKAIDVKPGNFEKLVVRGIHITVEADYDSYSIKDIDDENNEPTCIARGKRSVYQFYRWVKDNMKTLQTMTIGQAMDAMKDVGIAFHYYCAMD
jgi:hypothetical protein